MCRAQCVLAVVALSIGVAHSWDFAVSLGDQLMFYNDDGSKTETVHLESRNLGSLAYDEVDNMMLYVDKQDKNDTICGYVLSSKQNICFEERNGRNIQSIAYDPVTEKLFFIDSNDNSINWISLKRGSNKNICGNVLIKMDDGTPTDLAVESCGGYIYWSNPNKSYRTPDIERVRFNGSGREEISFDSDNVHVSLTIDPRARKMYFSDSFFRTLWSTDFNGKNEENVSYINFGAKDLTVSKDNIYWLSYSEGYKSVHQRPKNSKPFLLKIKEIKFYTNKSLSIAANYKILDQIKEIHDCESLSTTNAAPGNTGGRCDVPVCTNYCLHGNCTVNDKGLPKCSCNAGYDGERCEFSVCHGYCFNDGGCSLNDEYGPVCQCVGNYEGSRCEAEINGITPTHDSARRNLTLADLLSWRKPSSKMYVVVEV